MMCFKESEEQVERPKGNMNLNTVFNTLHEMKEIYVDAIHIKNEMIPSYRGVNQSFTLYERSYLCYLIEL